jgi:DNA (cytosine-5)-methyltransferase 1
VKPLLVDLYCGAGGAAKGYHDAGFDVIGVDIVDQPNYPYEFVQMDALAFMSRPISTRQFAAVHASPPCQRHSKMSCCRPGLAGTYPDMISDTRTLLELTGLPYVIENVPGAPLKDPVMLCGHMFGRDLYRHRLFETNWPLLVPEHPKHVKKAGKAGHWKPGEVISITGHVAPMKLAREVMEIGWSTRAELVEAIPPYYTAHIGEQLMREVI